MLTPLSAVAEALQQSLAPVTTQHAYGTQVVELLGQREREARSVSYFTATHFGMGVYEGQVSGPFRFAFVFLFSFKEIGG